MNRLDRIAKEYLAAREVIANALQEFGTFSPVARVRAEAILARLAAHDPPILLEMEEAEVDEYYDGPFCYKCRRPVDINNGRVLRPGGCIWLCDFCAAAAEHASDAQREQRRCYL